MPAGNQYHEHWTKEESEKFLLDAIKLSKQQTYDFIGEVAVEQNTYHHVYGYIVDKFPELKPLLNNIKANCERNCFYNGKKGEIIPSMAIMNLKSNHGWTDRSETNVNLHTEQPLYPPKKKE